MNTYQCEECDTTVEIEDTQAILDPPEYYECGYCQECFDKL